MSIFFPETLGGWIKDQCIALQFIILLIFVYLLPISLLNGTKETVGSKAENAPALTEFTF